MTTKHGKKEATSRKVRVEDLAKWLNNVCVDWAPMSFDWDAAMPQNAARRKAMRALAVKAMRISEAGA